MNKILLIITVAIGISTMSFGQFLKQNEIDEFTGDLVKRTNWVEFSSNMKFTGRFRISRINDMTFFNLKMVVNGSVFSMDKGEKLMFKMKNGDIVELNNLKYTITCIGCGASGLLSSGIPGIEVAYFLSNETIEILKKNTAVKIRIYADDFYVENDLRANQYAKIQKALFLVE